MAKSNSVTKRALIGKANSAVVIASGIAAFIFIFSMVASKTLFSQMQYQNRVISKEKSALGLLKSDIQAAGALNKSYTAFNATAQNVINGNPDGTGLQDGNNAKIVLDALPTTSDNLALTTSMYKLLNINGVNITGISGADQAAGATDAAAAASSNPQATAIPLTIGASGDYKSVQKVIDQLEHSIRPIQVQTMGLSGSNSDIKLSVTAQTYYQSAKSLNVTKAVVK